MIGSGRARDRSWANEIAFPGNRDLDQGGLQWVSGVSGIEAQVGTCSGDSCFVGEEAEKNSLQIEKNRTEHTVLSRDEGWGK